MKRHFFTYKQSVIHYSVFGYGEKLLLCFHGYGEDSSSFYFLKDVLEKDYTFIVIDLPFHGTTEWNEGLLLDPDILVTILEQIVSSIQQPKNSTVSQNKQTTFSLLGYSMGGRVALHLLQIIPSQIERVVLVAPDGLHKNFWYWLSTQTLTGNKLFRLTMKYPQWFFGLMKAANKFRLINKSIFRFAHQHLDDEDARIMLYKRWTAMRKFKPQLGSLKNIIKQKKISMRILFGRYDRIILSKKNRFVAGNKETDIQVHILETGHQLLKAKHAEDIATLFYD